MPETIVYEIVTRDLKVRKVCTKLVSKVLTEDQKTLGVVVSKGLVERF